MLKRFFNFVFFPLHGKIFINTLKEEHFEGNIRNIKDCVGYRCLREVLPKKYKCNWFTRYGYIDRDTLFFRKYIVTSYDQYDNIVDMMSKERKVGEVIYFKIKKYNGI